MNLKEQAKDGAMSAGIHSLEKRQTKKWQQLGATKKLNKQWNNACNA